jgi:putative acyl-CoA dehydrogenase
MRQCVVQAIHHARHREAFGSFLIEQPLMRSVLADMALESEAASAISLRLARAFDSDTESETALRRALTSAAKFWVCKRGCELAAEAMEVLGGNGYTEELPLARMVREMPVNSIWEGSGNIMCLDVLRAFGKSVLTREAVLQELSGSRGLNRDFDAAFERFAASLQGAARLTEAHARRFTQSFVTLMQGSLLLRGGSSRASEDGSGSSEDGSGTSAGAGAAAGVSAGASRAAGAGAAEVAEGFCATRLGAEAGWGAVFGAASAAMEVDAILQRAWPD